MIIVLPYLLHEIMCYKFFYRLFFFVGLAASAGASPLSLTFPWAQPNATTGTYITGLEAWFQNFAECYMAYEWSRCKCPRELTSARSSSQPMTGEVGVSITTPSPSRWGNSKEGKPPGFQSFPCGNKYIGTQLNNTFSLLATCSCLYHFSIPFQGFTPPYTHNRSQK